jgi:hypothetical protein
MVIVALLLTAAGCTAGTEYTPPLCPTGLPAIRSITIERSGYAAGPVGDPSIRCSTFRPTPAQVRAYLTKARRVPDFRSADATIDMVPCRARGSVTFANGRRGKWEVEQARFGNIVVPGRSKMLLYTVARLGRPFIDE